MALFSIEIRGIEVKLSCYLLIISKLGNIGTFCALQSFAEVIR